ncbi:hypothetical protein [Agromyces binzhouensis]|uniref:hypothetical protein n=1 Tax=Agromyces binzhouensis TaxID=1817495 RepID=UPI0036273E20
MAQLITEDDLDELELRVADGRGHVARADLLERWATDDAAFELAAGVRRAHLLLVAAEHFEMAGELDRALAVARRAAEASDAEPHEATGRLVAILLALGERDAALHTADALRGSGSGQWWRHLHVAESFEFADELELAERWFVITLRLIERDPEHDVADRLIALSGRFRVRRDAGKPEDVLDAESSQLRELLGYEPIA